MLGIRNARRALQSQSTGRAAATSPFPAALLGIAVFFTINAMVSGDVNDNRTMWASVAIGWVVVGGKEIQRARQIGGSTHHTGNDMAVLSGNR